MSLRSRHLYCNRECCISNWIYCSISIYLRDQHSSSTYAPIFADFRILDNTIFYAIFNEQLSVINWSSYKKASFEINFRVYLQHGHWSLYNTNFYLIVNDFLLVCKQYFSHSYAPISMCTSPFESKATYLLMKNLEFLFFQWIIS